MCATRAIGEKTAVGAWCTLGGSGARGGCPRCATIPEIPLRFSERIEQKVADYKRNVKCDKQNASDWPSARGSALLKHRFSGRF